eukprot:scaffold6008_cov118-Isochrysis_galbana.AAC.6
MGNHLCRTAAHRARRSLANRSVARYRLVHRTLPHQRLRMRLRRSERLSLALLPGGILLPARPAFCPRQPAGSPRVACRRRVCSRVQAVPIAHLEKPRPLLRRQSAPQQLQLCHRPSGGRHVQGRPSQVIHRHRHSPPGAARPLPYQLSHGRGTGLVQLLYQRWHEHRWRVPEARRRSRAQPCAEGLLAEHVAEAPQPVRPRGRVMHWRPAVRVGRRGWVEKKQRAERLLIQSEGRSVHRRHPARAALPVQLRQPPGRLGARHEAGGRQPLRGRDRQHKPPSAHASFKAVLSDRAAASVTSASAAPPPTRHESSLSSRLDRRSARRRLGCRGSPSLSRRSCSRVCQPSSSPSTRAHPSPVTRALRTRPSHAAAHMRATRDPFAGGASASASSARRSACASSGLLPTTATSHMCRVTASTRGQWPSRPDASMWSHSTDGAAQSIARCSGDGRASEHSATRSAARLSSRPAARHTAHSSSGDASSTSDLRSGWPAAGSGGGGCAVSCRGLAAASGCGSAPAAAYASRATCEDARASRYSCLRASAWNCAGSSDSAPRAAHGISGLRRRGARGCRDSPRHRSLPLTAVRNRDSTRLISTSMPSSGAWLDIVPDNTPRTETHSLHFEVALQRRLGLHLAHAAPTVRALHSTGRLDVDYFGDWMANGGEYNKRHNVVNYAVYEAISAVAVGAVLLGDKGAPQAYLKPPLTSTPRTSSTSPS